MDYKKIGNLISDLRKEKNMTQKDLAEKLLITDRAVSKWERGLGCPDISLLDDLSMILEISVIELLKGTRLTSEEKSNNKDLIESMTFAQETLKDRIKQIAKGILLFIFFVLTIVIIYVDVYAVRNETILYKLGPIDERVYTDFEKQKNLILSNQGNYTVDEYNSIIDYIENVSNLFCESGFEEYKEEKYYKYDDFIGILTNPSFVRANIFPAKQIIMKIILKYDTELVDELYSVYIYPINLEYDMYERSYIHFPLQNKNKFDSYTTYVKEIYVKEAMFLEYIIRTGDMYE